MKIEETQAHDTLHAIETGLLPYSGANRTVIEPPRSWQAINLAEIWEYRELLFYLTWRDVKVRYKQTVIGLTWVVLQPLLSMVVFTLLFGVLLNTPTSGDPYPVFAFVALLPWTFFSAALNRSAVSLVLDANLISKVYFPRLILPMAAVLSTLVDFSIAFVILLGLLAFYGISLGPAVFVLPVLLLITFLTALGFGLWLSAINVKYRDVGHAVPFVMQFWLFLTPVAYSSTLIPERWQFLYSLNPMAGVVEGFRWALLGQQGLPWQFFILPFLVVVLIFISGLYYFRRVEYEFADVV